MPCPIQVTADIEIVCVLQKTEEKKTRILWHNFSYTHYLQYFIKNQLLLL